MSHLDPRNMPASEEPLDLEIITQMKQARHYGFSWSGVESGKCGCERAACGLLVSFVADCPHGHLRRFAAAKQVHWARDCPGAG